jgi:hypothetical protein
MLRKVETNLVLQSMGSTLLYADRRLDFYRAEDSDGEGFAWNSMLLRRLNKRNRCPLTT